MKHMVNAVKLACFFVGCQISCVLNYHDGTVITLLIGTDRTKFLIRQRVAAFAVLNILPCIRDGRSQLLHLVFRHVHDMKCKTLCRFGSDSRKMG